MANITTAINKFLDSELGEDVRDGLATALNAVNADAISISGDYAEVIVAAGQVGAAVASTTANAATATTGAGTATTKAAEALASKTAAQTAQTASELARANSETAKVAAQLAETHAKTSETNSKSSETISKASEAVAVANANTAITKAAESGISAAAALTSEQNAALRKTETQAIKDAAVEALAGSTDLAEMIEARKGLPTLGDKINAVDAQLADITSLKANKSDLLFLKKDGIGDKALLNNGTYAPITGGSVSPITLYSVIGDNENGAITQKGIFDTLDKSFGFESLQLEDGFLDNIGVLTPDVAWKTTEIIDLDVVKISNLNIHGHDSVASICFYNALGNFISSIRVSVTYDLLTDDNLVIPVTAKGARISFSSALGFNSITLMCNGNEIKNNFINKDDNRITTLDELVTINTITDISSFPSNDVYTTTGLQHYDTWNGTGYKLIDFTKIEGVLNGYTNIYSIAYFDENNQFISGIKSSGNGINVDISSEPPLNAIFYILSAPMGQIPIISLTLTNNEIISAKNKALINSSKIEVLEADQFEADYLRVLYSKALCNGDSLTKGDYGSNPPGTANIQVENYPYYLNKITGWETVNNGECGINTIDFWTRRTQNIVFSGVNIIFMLLGTNGGLTDTLATDVVGTDYNTYANTNTGCYCKIIEYMKSQAPNALICLCSIPQNAMGKTFLDVTNLTISKIATKYNLPLVDFYNKSKMTFANGDTYRPIDDLHFGKLGYLTLAGEAEKLLFNYTANNPSVINIS